MFRTTRPLAFAALLAAAACTDRTEPEPAPESLAALRYDHASARERLARRVALALRDEQFRSQLKQDLDRSPVREGKLHFQRYLAASEGRARSAMARASAESEEAVSRDAAGAPALELYLPVPEHRSRWSGGEHVLVATVDDERQPPVAFSPRGQRIILSPDAPPEVPVLALVPVETDFDRPRGLAQIQGSPGDGGSSPLPYGLYMTNSHLVESFESWVKGAPEIEVHVLGQAGKTDSLTSYSCAGGAAAGYYYFDQNKLDWSGNVLLMTQAQINNYKSNHPDQNLRVFLVEDDDTSCQIKVDPARFSKLVKAVESAYPKLTGGKDGTSGIQRTWEKANAIQQILKALASFIKTNDELIGNAVESTVVGLSYPNGNWIIKGDDNETNGWIRLVMR